jgi:hypothetical protein
MRWILCASAAIAICAPASAQVNPANPSFSATADQPLLTHDFGTFRQGTPGTAINFSVFNRPAPSGTTSAMTLSNVKLIGYPALMPLQTGTVTGLPAGSSAGMQLSLNTSEPGLLSVLYTLDFTSDALGGDPKSLAISAYARILRRGDYDSDGDVDNTDLGLWRSNYGTSNSATDGNMDGIVNAADYILWRENYTGSLGGGSGSLSALAVPEPSLAAVAMAALGLLGLIRRRGR